MVMVWGFARGSLVTLLAIRYFFNTWSHLTQTPDVPKQASEAFAELRGILTQSWYIDAWQKQVFQHCFLTLGGFSKKRSRAAQWQVLQHCLRRSIWWGFQKKRSCAAPWRVFQHCLRCSNNVHVIAGLCFEVAGDPFVKSTLAFDS